MTPPSWKIPVGVSRGTWDYVQSPNIASGYDEKFLNDSLMQLDQNLVLQLVNEQKSTEPLSVADFGSGTGRIGRLLNPIGHRMLNFDLSPHMLAEHQAKCQYPQLNTFIEANLAELPQVIESSDLAQDSIDFAVCLFSSYGMIRGRKHRINFLRGVKTLLKPGSQLLLHVHNRYQNVWHPQGPAWLFQSWWQSLRHHEAEFGDRVYAYRNLPKMFLHIFGASELRKELRSADFSQFRLIDIDATSSKTLRRRPWNWLIAGGYFVLATAS